MKEPFISFSIEVTGGASINCWHETNYRLRKLYSPFSQEDMEHLDDMGLLGSGQGLSFNLTTQERNDSGDGMNYYFILTAKRTCDSGD